MTDDRTADETQDQEIESPPELADWWVWGVRKVAALIADLLLSARMLLGRFSAERDSPDPKRWLRHRREKRG